MNSVMVNEAESISHPHVVTCDKVIEEGEEDEEEEEEE